MKKQEAGFLNNTLVKILNGMALGLMASLVTGVILKQIGTYLHIQDCNWCRCGIISGGSVSGCFCIGGMRNAWCGYYQIWRQLVHTGIR